MNLSLSSLLFSFSVIFGTGDAFILEQYAPRNVSMILRVTNGAPWGDWGPPQFCAAGTYAVGYALKIESNQDYRDDTALNSINLVCKGLDAVRFGGSITSLEGSFGSWTRQVECSQSGGTPRFLTAFALEVEPELGVSIKYTHITPFITCHQSGDDTAANFLKFQCRDFAKTQQPTELYVSPGHGLFGRMGNWSPSCPPNTAICGLKTRVESNQQGGDDTALNDVIFYCCNDRDF